MPSSARGLRTEPVRSNQLLCQRSPRGDVGIAPYGHTGGGGLVISRRGPLGCNCKLVCEKPRRGRCPHRPEACGRKLFVLTDCSVNVPPGAMWASPPTVTPVGVGLVISRRGPLGCNCKLVCEKPRRGRCPHRPEACGRKLFVSTDCSVNVPRRGDVGIAPYGQTDRLCLTSLCFPQGKPFCCLLYSIFPQIESSTQKIKRFSVAIFLNMR